VNGDPIDGTDPLGLGCSVWATFNPFSSENCIRQAAANSRWPDYVTADLAGGPIPFLPGPNIVGIQLTITKDGHVFFGFQGGLGVPGGSFALRAGWVNQSSAPCPSQVDSFVGGGSLTASGYVPLFGITGPALGET